MDEERQAFQHSMGQAVGNQSAETVVKVSHPDGQVLGPRVGERWAVFLWCCLTSVNLLAAIFFIAAFSPAAAGFFMAFSSCAFSHSFLCMLITSFMVAAEEQA